MKNIQYLNYMIRHKWFVFQAGLKTKAPLWRLIIHDWSKFMPIEWIAYSNFFYGDKTKDFEPAFDRAWLHHIHLNPHHWNHWVLNKDDGEVKCLAMPEKFIREMVADWAGAGKAITGRWEVREWYEKEKKNIHLEYGTLAQVENLLTLF